MTRTFTVILDATKVGINKPTSVIWSPWQPNIGENNHELARGDKVNITVNFGTYDGPSLSTYFGLAVGAQAYTKGETDPTSSIEKNLKTNGPKYPKGYVYGISLLDSTPNTNDIFINAKFSTELLSRNNQKAEERAYYLTMEYQPQSSAKPILDKNTGRLAIAYSFGDPHVEKTRLVVK
ncbi:hypothetical protein [Thalassomonas sp. RHCl1]|uniref:hypothetical protein n=1 Tax=Thalassomonas sp. RHCl1 TaxID=2995320 RepID=UPI00248D384E|nr:hypothetical protein [Thalassomonas sp. RHCl1]